MLRRSYRPLLITATVTAIATIASCGFTVGIGGDVSIAGFDWISGFLTAGCVEIRLLGTSGPGTVLAPNPSFAYAHLSPFARPTLLPGFQTSAPRTVVFSTLTVPFWLIAAPLLTWQFYLARRFVPEPGQCRRCGYDIMAIRAPQCPECGTRIPSAVAAESDHLTP